MKTKHLLRTALLFASLTFFLTSCNDDETDEWAPYAGCMWYAEWGGDTACLELLTGEDVTLYSKNRAFPRANGKYATHRLKFPFSDFSLQSGAVSYCFHYASYDANLNLVLYGDSLNAECDTAFVEWSKPFTPAEAYIRPNRR